MSLYGKNDENLRLLRSKLRAKVVARGDELRLLGDEPDVKEAADTFRNLLQVIRSGSELSLSEIEFGDVVGADAEDSTDPAVSGEDVPRLPGRARPKTAG